MENEKIENKHLKTKTKEYAQIFLKGMHPRAAQKLYYLLESIAKESRQAGKEEAVDYIEKHYVWNGEKKPETIILLEHVLRQARHTPKQ